MSGRERKKEPWRSLAVAAATPCQSSPSVVFSSFIFCLSIRVPPPPPSPHPVPRRLAPVVVLRLAVGFMQALARGPGVTARRGRLVQPSVRRSVEVRGRRRRAVAVGQAALGSAGWHLALQGPGEGSGGRRRRHVVDGPG